jgi:hypothetical protein
MAGFRIAIEIAPGAAVAFIADTIPELKDVYEQAGGDPDWLVTTMREMIPATERGEGVGALSAALVGTLQNEAASQADNETGPDEPQETRRRVDPWSDEPVDEPVQRRSAARSGPSRASSDGSSRGGVTKTQDKWGNTWTLGIPEAPLCDGHHEPSARVNGMSRQNKPYTAFKCARGAPGGDWRTKCEFFQFPD